MTPYDVIVIGGGAAGMMAAITARRRGASVLLCEKMPKIGKKLLVTGAGRCNLLNETLDASFYNAQGQILVRAVLEQFGKEAMLQFFKDLGLATYADESGRVFPVTNQAASVLKVLEMELERLRVVIDLGCEIQSVRPSKNGFEVRARSGEAETGQKVILCAGGKSYPALGADGNGYALAEFFGHKILEPVPSTVALLVKDPWCHTLQGQKIRASVTSRIQEKEIRTVTGELLFTQYGLSGTAILDVSDEISVAVNRERTANVSVIVDLVPFMAEKELTAELSSRMKKGIARENFTEGLLPHKLCGVLHGMLKNPEACAMANFLKHKEFKVNGTRGWNEAEFTAGGVKVAEVDPVSLESRLRKGLYFAGEVLDVQGRRGGYNLAWAWASGAVAGSAI